MKKVLFIAYEFPPLKVGGVYRPLAFVKYLKDFGYEPIVITADTQSLVEAGAKPDLDETLGSEILAQHKIVKVPTELKFNKSGSFANFRDIYLNPVGREGKAWRRNFIKYADEQIKKEKPEVIFVTAPPFNVIRLADEIASRHKLPLVIDMRDAWSNWVTGAYGSYLHYLRVFFEERKVLESADKIVVTSLQTIHDFQKFHPRIEKSKFKYIPNGFDGDLKPWRNTLGSKQNITIGYVGSFYYSPESRKAMLTPWYRKKGHRMLQYTPGIQDWLYRSPHYFFKALAAMFTLYPDLRDRITVRFAGKKPEWMDEMIQHFGLESNVEFAGVLSHTESMEFQRQCDMLLLTSAKVVGGNDYSIAGKTFEYFQNQVPVLGFVCEGAQKEILRNSGMAILCDPDDTNGSAEIIRNAILGNLSITPNTEFIEMHTRRELTKSLAGIFDSLIHENN